MKAKTKSKLKNRTYATPIMSSGPYSSSVMPIHTNPWLILGNPLRALTPINLATVMENAMRGEWTQLQWLMMHAEIRDPDLIALVSYRIGALLEMDWEIKVSEKAKELNMTDLAEKQKVFLVSRYEKIDNLYEVIKHLGMAVFRGYSHVVKKGEALETLEQLWFVREGLYGPWFWNPDALTVPSTYFKPSGALNESDFIIRTQSHSIVFWAVMKYLYSTFGSRWWAAFCDAVSKQAIVIIAPQEVQQADMAVFKTDAEKMAQGSPGVLPFGSSVIQPNNNRGPNVFDPWMKYLSEKLVLAGTGGKLTMLNDSVGIGGGQSGTHSETFKSISKGDAREISEAFQHQYDWQLLNEAFPGQPVLAYFELCFREETNVSTFITDVANLAAAGYMVDPAQIIEKTGYKVTIREQPVTPERYSAFAGRAISNRNVADVLGVDNAWLQPVADLINEIEAKVKEKPITKLELASYLESMAKRVPELFAKMDIDAFAQVLEEGMGQQVIEGVKSEIKG